MNHKTINFSSGQKTIDTQLKLTFFEEKREKLFKVLFFNGNNFHAA